MDTKIFLQMVENMLADEQKIYDELEPEAAPSGEWAEYNIHMLVQESRVDTLEELFCKLREANDGL